jgi:hypothetical protein
VKLAETTPGSSRASRAAKVPEPEPADLLLAQGIAILEGQGEADLIRRLHCYWPVLEAPVRQELAWRRPGISILVARRLSRSGSPLGGEPPQLKGRTAPWSPTPLIGARPLRRGGSPPRRDPRASRGGGAPQRVLPEIISPPLPAPLHPRAILLIVSATATATALATPSHRAASVSAASADS